MLQCPLLLSLRLLPYSHHFYTFYRIYAPIIVSQHSHLCTPLFDSISHFPSSNVLIYNPKPIFYYIPFYVVYPLSPISFYRLPSHLSLTPPQSLIHITVSHLTTSIHSSHRHSPPCVCPRRGVSAHARTGRTASVLCGVSMEVVVRCD